MQLNAWDFGGQVIYHATHQFFLTDKSLFLLVWNARMGWDQCRLYYWLEAIKNRAPESPVILVATRSEEHQPVLPMADIAARYPMVRCLCPISNLTGAGIEFLRKVVALSAAALPRMGEMWPADWLDAAEDIRTRPDRYVSPDELDRLMTQYNIEPKARATLATTLHELGDILFFPDDEELKDTVILEPQWVSEYVCKVLDDPELKDKQGVLHRELRDQLWSDLAEPMRDRFLRLMEKFDLSYRTQENREISLMVERLPLDPPTGWRELWDKPKQTECCREVTMRYRFAGDLPPGIPTWFIARSHRFTTHTHWRTGSIFADGQTTRRHLGLVWADPRARTLELSVRGPMPYNFMVTLRDGLEFTLGRYPGLDYDRLMPCPGHKGRPCAHEFRFRDLEARLGSIPPRAKVECPVGLEDFYVPDLVFGLSWRTTGSKVFERIDEMERRIHERFDRSDAEHRQQHLKVEDLRRLAQRQFLSSFAVLQKDPDFACPNLFLLTGEGRRKREIQFLCQAPGNWHAPERGGSYPVKDLPGLVKAALPVLREVVAVLKGIADTASAAVPIIRPELLHVNLAAVKLTAEFIKTLPDFEGPPAQKLLDSDRGRTGADETHKAAMRAIRAFLDDVDPDRRRLGLKLTPTPEGHYYWLCEKHAKAYQA